MTQLRSFRKTVRGKNTSMTLDINRKQLIKMVNNFQQNGKTVLKKILKELAEEEVEMERQVLKAESTKQDWPWRTSPYREIADALRVNVTSAHVSVFTAPYPHGPEGSRGGKLAQIHMKSKDSWDIKLKDANKMVVSSGKWEFYEGRGSYDLPWFFDQRHEGFKEQPYTERILSRMEKKFEAKIMEMWRKEFMKTGGVIF